MADTLATMAQSPEPILTTAESPEPTQAHANLIAPFKLPPGVQASESCDTI